MIAVDTNILVYAHRRDSPFHDEAAESVRGLAEGVDTWAITWPSVHEFLAITTHPKIYDPPSTTKQAIKQIELWLESPTLALLSEPPGYLSRLKTTLLTSRVTGSRIPDARIAAICLTHGVRELWTADRDFSRFGQLTTVNPLTK